MKCWCCASFKVWLVSDTVVSVGRGEMWWCLQAVGSCMVCLDHPPQHVAVVHESSVTVGGCTNAGSA